MTDVIRVAVSGSGKMGQEVLAAVCREPDMQPVGVLERFATTDTIALPDGSGSVPMRAEPETLFALSRPQVLIDFTTAAWTEEIVPLAVDAGIRPVIGTTGLSPTFIETLAKHCQDQKLGGLVTANFALGAVILMHLAKVASPFFDYAEIIEMHHENKVDAPSGTALQTILAMREGRKRPFELAKTERETLPGTRGGSDQGITVHSVRMPGMVAHQEVIFGGLGQTLTIRHDSISRESFMPGVLLAVRAVMKRDTLAQGLDELIGLR